MCRLPTATELCNALGSLNKKTLRSWIEPILNYAKPSNSVLEFVCKYITKRVKC